MSSSRWLLVLAAAGCNAVFGNTPTVLDTDLDGTPDSIDNCPTRPNRDQADSDGDGTGDACGCSIGIDTDGDGIDDGCDPCIGPGPTGTDLGGDGIDDGCELCATANGRDIDHDHLDDGCDPCPSGQNHDEDGDGVFDACDVCPGLADPAQALDPDMDRLGALCDPSAYFNYTLVFDSFEHHNTAYWPSLAPWTITGDELRAPAQGATSVASTIAVTDTSIIETRIVTFDSNAKTGVEIRGSAFFVSCYVNQGTIFVEGGETSTPFSAKAAGSLDPTAPVRLRMRSHVNPFGPTSYWIFSCETIDDAGQPVLSVSAQQSITAVPAEGASGTVQILSTGGAGSFSYLWVVLPDLSAGV